MTGVTALCQGSMRLPMTGVTALSGKHEVAHDWCHSCQGNMRLPTTGVTALSGKHEVAHDWCHSSVRETRGCP